MLQWLKWLKKTDKLLFIIVVEMYGSDSGLVRCESEGLDGPYSVGVVLLLEAEPLFEINTV